MQNEEQYLATPTSRLQHQEEVLAFLQEHFSSLHWTITLPNGSGNETYFAQAGNLELFIKLEVNLDYYQALADLGLTPPLLAEGDLADGTSLLVQPKIAARSPSRLDFRVYLERFAGIISTLHSSPELRRILPESASELHGEIGLQSLARIRSKWERCKPQVPAVTDFVENALHSLRQQVLNFPGAGLAPSHCDPCNANWLVAHSGEIYLIDFDSLALDDPALDLGAFLWWYYPPELRPRFLAIAGVTYDAELQQRMQVRTAMHCLDILLPRERSFDRFDPATFPAALADFRAALAGEHNPQGYAA